MRYVSINSVPNLSTGTVMLQVTEEHRALGDECWCMWGRGRAAENDYEFNFGNRVEFYLDALQTRFDGKAGFHSKLATRRLLKKLEEIKPDVVHLHNVHGYYVNVRMLFDWLAIHEGVRVKWTLHDCWAFTGHCVHFTYAQCTQWRKDCAQSEGCPQLHRYPRTISRQSCAWNFEQKKACFTQLPAGRLTIVTPCNWLKGLVEESFLSKYPTEVRYNTIDVDVFRPTASDFRERFGIGKRYMVLGVASAWSDRKGLGDYVSLAHELDSKDFAIVLVGLTPKQTRDIAKRLTIPPKARGVAWITNADSIIEAIVHGAPYKASKQNLLSDCYAGHATVSEGSLAESTPTKGYFSTRADVSSLRASIVNLPGGGLVALLLRTDSAQQLAALYTAADVFFNPTHEDTYPTVNLEAEACGLRVVTYDTGGCRETIRRPDSIVIETTSFGAK